ncbi:DUF7674 family protein [Pontibacter sp. H249]|uniref:DUF7674 family protein n=1 Tax=Pontibacter sp. H249 TaxID=3133420 RepID=UPI0030C5F274
MIQHHEISKELCQEFPELEPELKQEGNKRNLHRQLACFATYTNRFLDTLNLDGARRCFREANKLLQEGDQQVRHALQVSYLYTLHLYSGGNSLQWRLLMGPALVRCSQQMTHNQLP